MNSPAPVVHEMTLVQMIAYAGATWDWHRTHYDQAYLDSVQLAAPIVDGQVFGALLAEQATNWAGPEWRISALDFRFANLVFAGEQVLCELALSSRDEATIRLTGRVVVVADGRPAVSAAEVELVHR